MYKSNLQSKECDELFKAILSLENIEECYRFFDDICSINELKSLIQRWQVVTMLSSGSTYSEIAKKTGISTATISRVSKCLSYGADGYKTVLKKLKNK